MYDAIVIGARCAGSPTAMLLARQGHRVLLVDRATFPSDTFKNHFILREGAVQLQRWGLLPAVQASNCPPVRTQRLDLMGQVMIMPMEVSDGVDAAYGPRRQVLDKILVDAAVAAGAELREGFTVQELVTDGDRVTGIRGKSRDGAVVTEQARIVVGAEGHHSLVARTMEAPAYHARPALTCGYFSYWSGLPCDGIEISMRAHPAFLLAFPTNDGLTCVAVQVPVAEFAAFRRDVEGYFRQILALAPALAERVHAGRREYRYQGTADLGNFFRKPYGPGWALVGDAGYHKDPITARGISDAFRDADLLATAIHAVLAGEQPADAALAVYEQQRNAAALPQYEEACGMAAFQLPSA
ncbi:MAG TPA: NAD(P)/FAD-dependent oxidoreductase [Chloroflexia bacterium]|nr:NAD(P)/FAD-dependent oxidoreductase [Chloroflexia bacterium]